MRHEVLGLVLTSLLKGGTGAALGSELRDGYGHTLQLLRRRAALWDLERDFVLSRLAAAGISVVLLKGAALRLSVYKDPVERQFGDVDVLVPPEQIAAAIPALEASGYLPESVFTAQLYLEHHHHLRLKKATGFMVEPTGRSAPDSPFELRSRRLSRRGFAALRRRRSAGPSRQQTRPLLRPSATQNVENGYSLLRGRWTWTDVIAATPGLDWDFLAAEVIRMKVTAPVAVSLRLAALLLETEFPHGFIASLGLTRAVRSNLALLDPVGLVTEQRAVTRAALSRLVVLWSIADRATRRRVFRDMSAGRYGELGRRLDGLPRWGAGPAGPRPPRFWPIRAGSMGPFRWEAVPCAGAADSGMELDNYPLESSNSLISASNSRNCCGNTTLGGSNAVCPSQSCRGRGQGHRR